MKTSYRLLTGLILLLLTSPLLSAQQKPETKNEPAPKMVQFQMALMNRRLAPEIETVFLQPAGRYSFVSSRMLKEVFSFGGDVAGLVPPNVLKRLRSRISAT